MRGLPATLTLELFDESEPFYTHRVEPSKWVYEDFCAAIEERSRYLEAIVLKWHRHSLLTTLASRPITLRPSTGSR